MANSMKFGNGQWATKKDSILAYNDENANFKPLPFVTSRASTATRVNKAGLLETVASGIPRVDYLGNTKGAYLLEPQSTNLIAQSEAFGSSYWTKSGASVVGGFSAPSADTPLGAFKLVEDSANSRHFMYTTVSGLTSSTDYNISFYVKAAERSNIWIYDDGGANNGVAFDLTDGSVIYSNTSENYSITTLADGWYRISIVSPLAVTDRYPLIELLEDSYTTGKPVAYTGNGTSGVYIFGAQLEQKSYATSYIKTSGSQITRLADTASQTVPDGIINSSEGVLYFEGSALADDATYKSISISDGSSANQLWAFYYSNNIRFIFTVGGVAQADISYSGSNVTLFNKIAIKWGLNDFKLYVNGIKRGEDGSGVVPLQGVFNRLNFKYSSGADYLYGKVKDLRVYKTALTALELETLTSYTSFNAMALAQNYKIQ